MSACTSSDSIQIAPQTVTLIIGGTTVLQTGARAPQEVYIPPLARSVKRGRDQDLGDVESPPLKVARGCNKSSAGTEVQPVPEESSSVPGLNAIVSELAAEIRGLKGHVVTLLGDIAAGSVGGLACTMEDHNCRHCRVSQEFRDNRKSESIDKWRYDLDSLKEESQIPDFLRPSKS
ncbi:hypothetical protein JVU11DRAFT_3704 [Chiua virens]|nr:hypothetical protein JVU11DRAFT_3704 [Chiua virens]